ncbi:TetR/AcrR family transcriptional regulator [uncultured Jatrophihabitans sp.]|uniref:TetR/AcrR family transcriptional regulator n=1 Tax=uncultured Jatrophihabitans sp. TaxID=1610747 RepID=UPI0035CC2544
MVDTPDTARGEAGPRGLSAERIVTETLALIDEQGIAAATMRTVGERLGVRAMALYRHIDNREELFDAVVERIVNELEDDDRVLEAPQDGDWRKYLEALAWGVRRYARAHPHAFPLVSTRPPSAPWINPPLRSLRWIEKMLVGLDSVGFDEEQVLFTYRTFNSFLLGYLLLETSAMALQDPKPGDGSFQSGTSPDDATPAEATDPVPGAISPTRTREQSEAVDAADTSAQQVDPVGDVDSADFPMIHRLRDGLTEDHYEREFAAGLQILLDRVAAVVAD